MAPPQAPCPVRASAERRIATSRRCAGRAASETREEVTCGGRKRTRGAPPLSPAPDRSPPSSHGLRGRARVPRRTKNDSIADRELERVRAGGAQGCGQRAAEIDAAGRLDGGFSTSARAAFRLGGGTKAEPSPGGRDIGTARRHVLEGRIEQPHGFL